MSTRVRFCPEVGRRQQQRGQLAVGAGRRLKTDRGQTGDLGQHLLEVKQQGQKAL